LRALWAFGCIGKKPGDCLGAASIEPIFTGLFLSLFFYKFFNVFSIGQNAAIFGPVTCTESNGAGVSSCIVSRIAQKPAATGGNW